MISLKKRHCENSEDLSNIPNIRKSIYAELIFLLDEKDTEICNFDKTCGKLLFK